MRWHDYGYLALLPLFFLTACWQNNATAAAWIVIAAGWFVMYLKTRLLLEKVLDDNKKLLLYSEELLKTTESLNK